MSTEDTGVGDLRAELDALRREYDEFRDFMPALLEADVANGRITFMNHMARILLGFDEADVAAGISGWDLLDNTGAQMIVAVRDRHLAASVGQGKAYEHTTTQDFYEANLRRKDGTWFAAEAQGAYALDPNGFPRRIRFMFRDVSRRKAAESALKRSEEQLRSFAANAPVILLQLDREGTIVLCEGKGLGAFGLSSGQLQGWSAASVALRDTPFGEIYRKAQAGESVAEKVAFGGLVLDIRAEPVRDDTGTLTGFVAVATDVTELDSAERALVQSQRMESLGILAGGIAHDFNNVLSSILALTSMLKRSPSVGKEDMEHVRSIEHAARRGSDVTRRVLAFARGGLPAIEVTDLREVVTDVANLASPSLKHGVSLRTDFPASPVLARCEKGQLTQALLNIVLNARDAMPEGGEIRLTAGSMDRQAIITVSDTGTGMDEATRAHIFEPFYTTKPPGQGTGLGLSVAFGIVAGHHGTITVRSVPGQGSTFIVTLPSPPGLMMTPPAVASGRAVLVADPGDLVRHSTAAVLEHLGFVAVEAASAGEAISLVSDDPGRFAAVIIDLATPGLPITEAVRTLREQAARLPIIICTGHAIDGHMVANHGGEVASFLQKPFDAEQLGEALQSCGVALPA